MSIVRYTNVYSPLGTIFVAFNGKGISDLSIGLNEESFKDILHKRHGIKGEKGGWPFQSVINRLKDYFSRSEVDFRDIPLSLEGTAFEHKVWQTILEIPYGETRSYKWLAHKVGNEKAFRAVGRACGKNPVPLIIPCHRVVKETGELGGYSSGLWIKRRLLEIEGHSVRVNKTGFWYIRI